MRKLFPHEIYIKQADNDELAFIVSVGCKTFAFTDKEKMIQAFGEYIRGPMMMHRKYAGDYPEPVATCEASNMEVPQCES